MVLKQISLLLPLVVAATVALGVVGFRQTPATAADLTGGVMVAVPVPGGKAPTIDGNLADWDLSGAEPLWISAQTAAKYNASVALMYDETALYVGARVAMPNRLINNPNNPVDAYWTGDVLELRVASDPALPAPLNGNPAVEASKRIVHMTFWKNSETGKDYVGFAYGVHLDKGTGYNLPGCQVAIQEDKTEYTLEARIPWSALNVPDGKNPFTAGSRMTAVWGVIWTGEGRTAALYRTNPGDFAFSRSPSWGQVEFSPVGHLKPRHETMEEVLAVKPSGPVGMPFTINLPKAGKVSVNIFGPHGEVIRELMGGEKHPKGPLTLYWDGHDQNGFAMTPGKYRWGAYISNGLEAECMGIAGMSGTPPYQTNDNRGGWIGDHSELADVAADATCVYIVCPVAEAQRSIIKVGPDDKTVWRKTPWVGGGWGPLYAIAANGKYVFITFGNTKPQLVRLDAATGQLLQFEAIPGAPTVAPISDAEKADAPVSSSPIYIQPESCGIAASAREVFASVFSKDMIQVLDAETGLPTRQIPCPAPRGVALDAAGNLYAVSYGADGHSKIIKFAGGHEPGVDLIGSGLVDPWHVAVDMAGRLYVSQEGASQQVAVFDSNGKPVTAIGKRGGRTWGGAYRPDGLLNPSGLAIDNEGRLLVVESAIPKLVSRYSIPDLKLVSQWYGAAAYWNANFPDPDNPLTCYYPFEPSGFGRATVNSADGYGPPTGSWDVKRTSLEALDDPYAHIASPELKYLDNGRKYLYSDTNHGIFLIDHDQMVPIGSALTVGANDKTNTTHKNYIALWSDTNGNHKIDPDEVTQIDTIQGAPLPGMASQTGSMWIADNGDLYLVSEANRILRIPAEGTSKSGTIRWSPVRANWVATSVIPSCGNSVFTGWRQGLLGVRVDRAGNLYTCYNYNVPSMTGKLEQTLSAEFPDMPRVNWQAYATPELATRMHEGLGHSSEFNAVKFVKLNKNGVIQWVAGRKATAAAQPGELYHFWVLAGMVGDNYIAGGSEWGQMYIYTADGFYVDALFNNPGLAPPPGPYTFGGETSGGRIQYFKRLGQVYAYCTGGVYLVKGFDKNGRVQGETRLSGDVVLDRIYEPAAPEAVTPQSLTIARLAGNPLADPAAWVTAPPVEIRSENQVLATARFGYDDQNLYGLVQVADPTPLQNSADGVNLAFKGGDAVGIDLGPAGHASPAAGDTRILAAQINGKAHLVGMKPISAAGKKPQDYFTPGGGAKHFDFVGDIPGGKVTLTPDADGQGYTALFAVPRAFLEVPLTGKPLDGDVEVLLSGQGARGLQATSRNYLFSPKTSATTMVDDIPTESWLYPQYWAAISVK